MTFLLPPDLGPDASMLVLGAWPWLETLLTSAHSLWGDRVAAAQVPCSRGWG